MSVSGVLVAFIADLSLLFQIDDSSTFGVASPVLSVLKRSLQDECITEQPRCVYEIAEATRLESKAALLHLFCFAYLLCESAKLPTWSFVTISRYPTRVLVVTRNQVGIAFSERYLNQRQSSSSGAVKSSH